MYTELLVYFLVLFIAGILGYKMTLKYRPHGQRPSTARSNLVILFIGYIAAVVSLTIIPSERFSLNTSIPLTNYVPVLNTYKRYALVTWFENHHGIKNFWQNFIGNILLFIPAGIFLALIFRMKLTGILLVAFLASFVVESIQFGSRYFGYYRHVDIDDVILNTFGAGLGYGLLRFYKRVAPATKISIL